MSTGRSSTNIPSSLRKIWQEQEEHGRAYTGKQDKMTTKAIVSHDTLQNGGWKMEEVGLRELEEGELLVEMVATGVCE
ncbi:hypothetical protein AC578_3045 [Pseudocercospora eumusae]|uniref:Uncharacterized protein n=1 Tax=Pseudocercospora eumusae TaxID=321146 RepID=A0A139H9S6_9PEZI|nr:hypothetical protein AC578_3045 [Pseudocercospora eumusae]